MKVLKNIVLPLLLLSSVSINASVQDKLELNNNPVKAQTIVLKESKQVDEDIQAQLDVLLDEFMEELDKTAYMITDDILSTAFDYEGVRYRYGGTSYSGIDCSGLIVNAFASTDLNLPRTSRDLARVGEKVKKSKAKKGDLIFFNTRGNRISHVGIITEVTPDDIKFIHSSTSRGVIVSSINENYYKRRFVQINRVLSDN
ncbi:C40 family peptidase [Myroides pelagicus]|uniref:NlpC/P60 family protein n=1 Tax=Myroides pelagicus TaxID=270914 RepID=A0A7K1GJ23_9FLAO|nr:C40 family peptidase [Myroides pelagicus]MTH28529.1 NlpC/P60 family protein [Myroides pelagicus]